MYFDGSTRTTNNNDLTNYTSFPGITFNPGAAAFTLGGNAITLGTDGITNNSTNLQTVNIRLSLDGMCTFDAASGNLVVAG